MSVRPVAALLLLSLAACNGGTTAPDTISRERFVRANIALRAIADTVAGADTLRAAALRKTGVTAPQLRAWVRAHGRDGVALADAWREIADSLLKRDSIVAARLGPPLDTPAPPSPLAPSVADAPPRPVQVVPDSAVPRTAPAKPPAKPPEVREQMVVEPDSSGNR